MSNVPIVTAAGASMRDYCTFWICVALCVLAALYFLHRDLRAIATAIESKRSTTDCASQDSVVAQSVEDGQSKTE